MIGSLKAYQELNYRFHTDQSIKPCMLQIDDFILIAEPYFDELSNKPKLRMVKYFMS